MKLQWVPFLLLVLGLSSAHAEIGVTANEISIGMVNAQSGASASLGQELKRGSMVYIDKVNKAGGINGRKIKIVSYDDQYDPKLTAEFTEKAIENDKVFALFDFVGTPTGAAAVPLIGKANVPLVGMFTGAQAFRIPVNSNIFHIRGSYWDETELMVNRLTEDLKITEVGSLAQDDAFGVAVRSGIERALTMKHLKLSGNALMPRNSDKVEAGVNDILKSKPKAIILTGAYLNCGTATKMLRQKGFTGPIFNVSFVGTAKYIEEAGAAGEGTYITQVMPSYMNTSVPLVSHYQADMKTAGHHDFNYGSLEGYANAIVLVEALKQAGKDLTRDNFRQAFMKLKGYDIGGFKLNYTPENHTGIKNIFLTKVSGGKPVEVTSLN
jgi:ABC-type branched-subunit amino acid transport system substrate-binding protein